MAPDPSWARLGWERVVLPPGLMSPPALLVRRGLAADRSIGGITYVSAAPRLARDEESRPRLSLTLTLARQPRPDEPDLLPLIRLGLLSMEVSLGVPEAALTAASPRSDARPLFSRLVRFELTDEAVGEGLASVSASGPSASGALSATLERAGALDVLAALDGHDGALRLGATVDYAVAAGPVTVRLTGRWADIHDAFSANSQTGDLNADDIRRVLGELVTDGRLMTETEPSVSGPGTEDAAFDAFMSASAFLLERRPAEAGGAGNFRLRARPSESMPLDVRRTTTSLGTETIYLSANLKEVIGGCLDGLDRDRYIRLVAPIGGGFEIGPISPITPVVSRVASRGNGSAVPVRSSSRGFEALSLALVPDRTIVPDAHSLMRSDALVATRANGPFKAWLANDLVLRPEQADEDKLPLPVVADDASPLWPDRLDGSTFWYAPQFVLDVPAASDDPASASFLFRFIQSGVTPGPNPTPGLNGTVRFQLRRSMPSAVAAAIAAAGNPTARPVATDNLSVSLEIPFRDETGATQSQSFVATVEGAADTVTASIDLLDSWVRLCYGALAFPRFQAHPPAVRVAYAFRAYVPVDNGDVQTVFGGKIARLQTIPELTVPVDPQPGNGSPAPDEVAIRLPGGVLRIERELRATEVIGRRGARDTAFPAAVRPAAGFATATHVEPIVAETAVRLQPIAPIRPELTLAEVIATRVHQVSYASRTFVREQAIDAVMPCSTLAAFYRSGPLDSSTAVGCQDALRLGEVKYRQYEEIGELGGERLRVYRSLQQPGRFLAVPASYRITRYGPSEPGRAYRPVVLVYSVLDEARGSRYFLSASLQPDVAPFERFDLLERLRAHTPAGHEPSLDFPTDPAIQSQMSFEWATPAGWDPPTVLQVWGGFQVTVSADITQALLLTTMIEHDGLNGTVRFHLPDGQDLRSGLALDTRVVGPWLSGPVEITSSAGSVTLKNRIERSVDVFELVVHRPAGSADRHTVDQTVAPGATTVLNVSGGSDSYVTHSVASGPITLDELSIFPEDVDTTLTFVNLVRFSEHGLASMAISARLPGRSHVDHVELPEAKAATLTMAMPLTTYLHEHVVEFRVESTDATSSPSAATWRTWDFREKGVVISIDSELIG